MLTLSSPAYVKNAATLATAEDDYFVRERNTSGTLVLQFRIFRMLLPSLAHALLLLATFLGTDVSAKRLKPMRAQIVVHEEVVVTMTEWIDLPTSTSAVYHDTRTATVSVPASVTGIPSSVAEPTAAGSQASSAGSSREGPNAAQRERLRDLMRLKARRQKMGSARM